MSHSPRSHDLITRGAGGRLHGLPPRSEFPSYAPVNCPLGGRPGSCGGEGGHSPEADIGEPGAVLSDAAVLAEAAERAGEEGKAEGRTGSGCGLAQETAPHSQPEEAADRR